MKLEKLLALIRLANNNPNEHEANLAARKVCKILATNEFSIATYQPRTAAGKMNEARTWNDVKRSSEPEFRSASNPNSNAFWSDFVRNYGRTRERGTWHGFDWSKAPEKDAPEPDYEPPRYKASPPKEDDYDWVTGKRKQRPQEKRKCSKCGLEIMTFRIKEDPWVCNFCHWKEYP